MRKVSLVMLILIAVLVASCKSTGSSVNDDTFRRIYNKYSGDLILDGAQKYTVKSGDSLTSISRSFYGDGYYYPLIMLASKDVVADPDKIQPGMVLTIPDLDKNLSNARSTGSIKGVIRDCAGIEDSRGRTATAQGLRNIAASL